MRTDAKTSRIERDNCYRCTHCLMCHSPRIALALPLAPSALGNDYVSSPREQESYSLSLFLCLDCGNVQLEDVVDPDILFRGYTYATQHSLGLVKHFEDTAALLARRAPAPAGALALDIGSNDGSLLLAFRELGFRVLGVDPALEIARRATAAGVDTMPDYFTAPLAQEIRVSHGPAAIITANNVFAHSDRLPEMADGIRSLLAADGIFSFEVSYLLDIVEKLLFDTIYHEHLCYHSVRSLDGFFRRHELQLIDIERLPTKGGSLRGTAQRAGGPRPVAPTVAMMIEWETRQRLHSLETFQAYARRIESAKMDFVSLLDSLRAQGKRIAGYGASPTVTTLLHQFELSDRLDYLVDDNPLKQNTFSPGQHVPVYPSQALYERGADAVAILAWNYARPIISKHQRFGQHGGRFIVPLPQLLVA